jgi:hypothetical protein
LEHFLFFHILGMSSSQLTFIFFRGVAQPPTSYGTFNLIFCCPNSSQKNWMVGSMNPQHTAPFWRTVLRLFPNFGPGQILWLSRHVTSNPKDRYDGFREKKQLYPIMSTPDS